ncbi:hypothetical protein ECANGB1_1095 [Enterospora canceri]|uniref:Uncharacterized protein n=1 Tax=Enterospora canceri TaxID=1081671 RepID=A0A1Y1S842_9MICR|nr:hypothetical protein ECANGB1_1095 [Enterospora canceri]
MAEKILKKKWKGTKVKRGSGLVGYERRKAIKADRKRQAEEDREILDEMKRNKREYHEKKKSGKKK